jgi:hypothetical protein
VRIRLLDSPLKKTDTANRQNTAGEEITKNNPGAGLQDREDKVSSIYGVSMIVAPQGEKPNKSSYQIQNP